MATTPCLFEAAIRSPFASFFDSSEELAWERQLPASPLFSSIARAKGLTSNDHMVLISSSAENSLHNSCSTASHLVVVVTITIIVLLVVATIGTATRTILIKW